ncbi:MAG: gas vesicle structural protein, partial [Pseudonocardiales bacterium]|nr:gas vesicle structural protein [Pseudonocardiales bacterium]
VIASVDTYLRFAEATNRLDLYEHGGKDLGELAQSITEGGAKGKTSGAISGAKEMVGELLHGDDDDDSGTTQRRRPRQHQGTPRRRTRHEDDDE